MTDLYNCRLGEDYSVRDVILNPSERARLGALGLVRGAKVSVKVRTRGGAIILSRGASVALSKKLCRRVVLEK